MLATDLESQARRMLASAGIEVGGSQPADIVVHNPGFYARVLHQGSLGLGESYMDGWWDSARLDQFFYRALSAGLDRVANRGWRAVRLLLGAALLNRQTRSRAPKVA